MKRKYKILLIVILLAYPVYKSLRGLVWAKTDSYMINKDLKIKIVADPDILGFQDLNIEKRVTIINIKTDTKLKLEFTSLEWPLFFYIDSSSPKQTISIVDQFAGQNVYEISTLQLLSKLNAFIGFPGGNGCNDECLTNLGKPYLIYDHTGFHN